MPSDSRQPRHCDCNCGGFGDVERVFWVVSQTGTLRTHTVDLPAAGVGPYTLASTGQTVIEASGNLKMYFNLVNFLDTHYSITSQPEARLV